MYDSNFFEKLALGQLKENDLSIFKQDLASDEQLQKEARAYRLIFDGLNHLALSNKLTEVHAWESECKTETDFDSELIDAYVNQRLTDAEKEYVKKRMTSDANFENAVMTQDKLSTGFEQLRVEEMISEVKIWENEVAQKEVVDKPVKAMPIAKRRRLFPRKFQIGVAAALIPLFIGGQIVLNTQFGNKALLKSSYALPLSNVFRGGDTGKIKEVDMSLNAMKSGNFLEAESILNEALSKEANNPELLLMKAHVSIQQKNYQAAEVELSTIQVESETQSHERDWLQALIAIGLKHDNNIIETSLEKVAENGNNPHELEAKALLEKMNSGWRKWLIFK